jgi:hypothetical protein
MGLEHYVPRGYLRHFAPENDDLVSRYSLVEKHEGGGYHSPRDRYPIKKAAAIENFADGWLETDDTSFAEREMLESLRRLISNEELTEDDIAGISTFLAFQHSRTPKSVLFYSAREKIPHQIDQHRPDLPEKYNDGWKNALIHNVEEGYHNFQFMGWIVAENYTDIPLITSDKPDVHYLHPDFEEVSSTATQMRGREVYLPLDQDHILILLDPEYFDVESQYPSTEIKRMQLSNSKEIHKFNILQGVNAFQEVFGPVSKGNYLENIIETLCEHYPHEDFIRGNRADLETLMKATDLATGMETEAERQLYQEKYRPLIQSRKLKSDAIWMLNHNLELTSDLLRDEPKSGYWDRIQSGEDPPRKSD